MGVDRRSRLLPLLVLLTHQNPPPWDFSCGGISRVDSSLRLPSLLCGYSGSNLLLSNGSLYCWDGLSPQLGLGGEPPNPAGLGCLDTPAPARHWRSRAARAAGAAVSWIPAGGSVFGAGSGNLHYWMPPAHQFR